MFLDHDVNLRHQADGFGEGDDDLLGSNSIVLA